MKDRLLVFMTCCGDLGKCEGVRKLEGLRWPASHVRSTNFGGCATRLKAVDMMPGLLITATRPSALPTLDLFFQTLSVSVPLSQITLVPFGRQAVPVQREIYRCCEWCMN